MADALCRQLSLCPGLCCVRAVADGADCTARAKFEWLESIICCDFVSFLQSFMSCGALVLRVLKCVM